MKELPILFSTDMVKAILDGRKMVTRRVINPQPKNLYYNSERPDWGWHTHQKGGIQNFPKYQKGDLLYVRENWWAVEVDEIGIQYFVYEDEFEKIPSGGRVPKPKVLRLLERQTWKYGRHPSIHMPKKYARIWLEVLDVRAERLGEITDTEAIREGIPDYPDFKGDSPRDDFQTLWNKLNDKRGYGWDINPWVWRYEFKKIKP